MTNPLATLTPAQVEAMIVQTQNLALGWSQAAEHALTDAENARCRDLAVGYSAVAKALEQLRDQRADLTSSPIVEAMEFAECTHYGERLYATIVEAEIRGMRRGYDIAHIEQFGPYSEAPHTDSVALNAAIHAIREGGGR